MKRIGILGGTFNPLHIGHLAIAQAAYEKLKLEKVIFVPANVPPHKRPGSIIPCKQRFEMVRLITDDNPRFEVSDFEVKRPGKSYTIDTVKHFQKKYDGKAQLFFILGEDSAGYLHEWKNIKELLKLVTFVAVNRAGCEPVKAKVPVRLLAMPALEISSSEIRRRIAQEKSVRYIVPEDVLKYIKKKKLYK
ncbi:MAG: nicotinate-nucleotide adenylyltransferase [Candidatus Omnitrophica bacterium]|nr:nicotinate-nucleotide adenylyltransferase [Candidatus Omnitrophota bacterium]